jgi:hypothetical protein
MFELTGIYWFWFVFMAVIFAVLLDQLGVLELFEYLGRGLRQGYQRWADRPRRPKVIRVRPRRSL